MPSRRCAIRQRTRPEIARTGRPGKYRGFAKKTKTDSVNVAENESIADTPKNKPSVPSALQSGAHQFVVQKLPPCRGAMGSEPDRLQRFRAYRLYLYHVNEVLNGSLGI